LLDNTNHGEPHTLRQVTDNKLQHAVTSTTGKFMIVCGNKVHAGTKSKQLSKNCDGKVANSLKLQTTTEIKPLAGSFREGLPPYSHETVG
jgi:hypothetical protein